LSKKIFFLDCTLRDGGYYNDWDFESDLVQDYLHAMDSSKIDFIEIGFRTLKNQNFKGGFAYSTDIFLSRLAIPLGLSDKIGVMINGSEIADQKTQLACLQKLFKHKTKSPVTLVRIACHVDEFINCLPASKWLKEQGYLVGFNLMQVADQSLEEITQLAQAASTYPIEVLYFADSMGSLNLNQLKDIIHAFQKGWKGPLGIHTHDNMGQAVNNSIHAVESGITWVDSTVAGMGRGPGNAQTEYLTLALSDYRQNQGNSIKLLELIRKYFKPMQNSYGWGINPFYYLTGQYGIHPSYIQEMLQDQRYNEEDIMTVIDFLKIEGGKKFSLDTLEAARHFYSSEPQGTWEPDTLLKNKTVLILGTGPSIKKYQSAIEDFIEYTQPYVIALNAESNIRHGLINARAACHPARLLSDCQEHLKLPEPLITPLSMLPKAVKKDLEKKAILDFGVIISNRGFSFNNNYCELPSSLVIAYTLAIANSGKAKKIILAGFDGYNSDDPRSKEMDQLLKIYKEKPNTLPLTSITPTRYNISIKSIFGMNQ
jgi:4-hydroxy 2-oxovalerate aldolase